MKAVSLYQPWASLLVRGKKLVETRGRSFGHRGPLLIHAAKRFGTDQSDICFEEPFRSTLIALGMLEVGGPTPDVAGDLAEFVETQSVLKVVLGAVIGRVEVVDCYRTEDVSFDYSGLDATPNDPVDQYAPGKLRLWHEQKPFGDYSPDRFAILCRNPVAFAKPIPFRGSQGLFEVPDDLLPPEVKS